MALGDLYNNLGYGVLYQAAITATTTATNYADLDGFESVVVFATIDSDTASAGNGITLAVWESDLDGATPAAIASYSAVASADLEGAFAQVVATGTVIQCVGYKGAERYLTVKMTEEGTYSGYIHISVIGIPNRRPDTSITVAAITS